MRAGTVPLAARAGVALLAVWIVAPVVTWAQTDATTAQQMKLWKTIDLGRHRGTFPCLGDLDADGKVDVLVYRQGPQTTPGFLAAIGHDGRELWSLGDVSVATHQADGMYREPALRGIALIYDLDQDGKAEVVTECWRDGAPMLYVLDGATGRIERQRESPFTLDVRGGKRSRCHPLAKIAFLHGTQRPPAVVMKYEASGRVPTHAVALDAELNTIWHVRAAPTDAGHLPSVGDVDGDGRDEIALGTLLVDDDGSEMWRKSAQNHADCTAIFQPAEEQGRAVLISICNSGPAFCVSASGETIWQCTTQQVRHGQGIWAGDFVPQEPGQEVIILKSGHRGDFMTVRGSDGQPIAEFQHRREREGYPDFPCIVRWSNLQTACLWIPIDRCLVDGKGRVVADLGAHEELVRQRLHWGTTKSHVATQAFAADLCGDERDEVVLYQPYHGEALLIFTQSDSDARNKPFVPQSSLYNIHSYF